MHVDGPGCGALCPLPCRLSCPAYCLSVIFPLGTYLFAGSSLLLHVCCCSEQIGSTERWHGRLDTAIVTRRVGKSRELLGKENNNKKTPRKKQKKKNPLWSFILNWFLWLALDSLQSGFRWVQPELLRMHFWAIQTGLTSTRGCGTPSQLF